MEEEKRARLGVEAVGHILTAEQIQMRVVQEGPGFEVFMAYKA